MIEPMNTDKFQNESWWPEVERRIASLKEIQWFSAMGENPLAEIERERETCQRRLRAHADEDMFEDRHFVLDHMPPAVAWKEIYHYVVGIASYNAALESVNELMWRYMPECPKRGDPEWRKKWDARERRWQYLENVFWGDLREDAAIWCLLPILEAEMPKEKLVIVAENRFRNWQKGRVPVGFLGDSLYVASGGQQ